MAAMTSAPSSAELLSRVVSRDADAFALLYDQYAPLVFKLVLRMMKDRAEAEDLLQEIFLQVWRTAASYDARRGDVSAWLTTIARSRAIDRLRSPQYRWRAVEMPEGAEAKLAGGSDPRDELSAREGATTVRHALAALPEEQRRVIELAYFDGLTQSQIAQKVQEPLGTVKTRIRLGMLKLRGVLALKQAATG
jgi:RNA polymerase sigma-70 factor (ECF subfamily)